MVRLDFYLNNGNAFLTISGETRHSLAAGQGYDFAVTSSHHDWRVGETTHGAFHAYTDPSRYDLTSSKWRAEIKLILDSNAVVGFLTS